MWFLTLLSMINVFGDISDNTANIEEKKPPKILVVYYSNTGTTEKIGGLLAVALNADQEKLADKKERKGFWNYIVAAKDAVMKQKTEIDKPKYDPSDYDLVIIGTPVWAWTMTPAVRTYIDMNKNKLKNVVFFTTSGGTPFDKIVPEMEELTGKKAVTSNGFFEKEVKEYSKEMIDKLNQFLNDIKASFSVKI